MDESAKKTPEELTSDQLHYWRLVLFHMLGPGAFKLSDEDIQKLHDNMLSMTPPVLPTPIVEKYYK